MATSRDDWTAGEDQAGKEWTGENLSKPIHLSTFFCKKNATVRAWFLAKSWQEELSDRLLIGTVSLSCDASSFPFYAVRREN